MKTSTSGTQAAVTATRSTVHAAHSGVDYQAAQLFVETQYLHAHNARIECDFPTLMAVCDRQQRLLSVAGIRSPRQSFFLEHYLTYSAETMLSELFQKDVAREKIVEVGNLAGGRDRLATTFLMHQMWDYLIRCGFEYLILTGTASLLHKFRQLPLHHLTDATADQIPNASYWGSYYQASPRVVAGKLTDYDFRFYRRGEPERYEFEILTDGSDR